MAKKVVGNLVANVSLGTSALSRGAKKAKAITSGVAGHMRNAFGRIPALGSAVLGMAGAASLTILTKNSMASIDATSKLSDQLGITVRNLKGLQFAAEQSGAASEVFNGAIAKMNKNIGDAIDGLGTAGPMLDKLGLDAQTLADQDAGKSFMDISDAIRAIKNPAEQASAAYAIFGRKGGELLTMINAGSDAMKKMVDENEKLGNSFSRVDGAKVEAANDAMNRLSKIVVGVGQSFAIGLAPYIEATANEVVRLTGDTRSFGDVAVNSLESVAKGVGFVRNAFHIWGTGIDIIAVGWSNTTSIMIKLMHKFGEALISVVNLLPGVEIEFTNKFREMYQAVDKHTLKLQKTFRDTWEKPLPSEGINRFFDNIRNNADKAAKSIVEAGKKSRESGKMFSDLKEGADSLKELEQFAKRMNDSTVSPLEKLEEQKGLLKQSLDSGMMNQDQYQRGLDKIKKDAQSALGIKIPESEMDAFEAKIKNLKTGLASGIITQDEFNRSVAEIESGAKDRLGDRDAPVSAATGSFSDIRSSEGITQVLAAMNAERNAAHVDQDKKKQLEIAEQQLTALEKLADWAEDQGPGQFALASIGF